MCLNVVPGTTKRVAAQDIQVYKVLEANGAAPYQSHFKYKTHELYELGSTLIAYNGAVNEGYHTFSSLAAARKRRMEKSGSTIVVVGIIPKGASYYVGQNFEMVSSEFVIVSMDNVA